MTPMVPLLCFALMVYSVVHSLRKLRTPIYGVLAIAGTLGVVFVTVAVPMLDLGLATGLLDNTGNPLNGTGHAAGCWPNYRPLSFVTDSAFPFAVLWFSGAFSWCFGSSLHLLFRTLQG
jgi:hypothetical protein